MLFYALDVILGCRPALFLFHAFDKGDIPAGIVIKLSGGDGKVEDQIENRFPVGNAALRIASRCGSGEPELNLLCSQLSNRHLAEFVNDLLLLRQEARHAVRGQLRLLHFPPGSCDLGDQL